MELPPGDKGKRTIFDRYTISSQAALFELKDDQLLQSRRAEILARSRPDSGRIFSTPTLADLVSAPTPHMTHVSLVPPARILNRLKGYEQRTILEEKLLSIDSLAEEIL